jgi:hypothetical protein
VASAQTGDAMSVKVLHSLSAESYTITIWHANLLTSDDSSMIFW